LGACCKLSVPQLSAHPLGRTKGKRRMKKRFGFITVCLFVVYTTQCQQKINYPAPCDCNLAGMIADKDTNGTNVRSGPNGKVIDRLISNAKGTGNPDERSEILVLSLLGHQSGWIKVSYNVSKQGWIYGGLIGTGMYGEEINLYSKPDVNSKVVAHFHNDEYKEQFVFIYGCSNTWAFVKAKDSFGKIVYGWLDAAHQCSNPYTTCGN
jgi:hypothetical protein